MTHLLFLSLIAYAVGEGMLWGGVFAHNAGQYIKDHNPLNIHLFVLPLRFFVFISLLLAAPHCGGGFFPATLSLFAGLLTFPFFHNGTYYETRRMQEPDALNHYRFWHTSKTTTAKLNFPFWLRAFFMLVGFFLEGVVKNLVV
jgi:hypothetical protein